MSIVLHCEYCGTIFTCNAWFPEDIPPCPNCAKNLEGEITGDGGRDGGPEATLWITPSRKKQD